MLSRSRPPTRWGRPSVRTAPVAAKMRWSSAPVGILCSPQSDGLVSAPLPKNGSTLGVLRSLGVTDYTLFIAFTVLSTSNISTIPWAALWPVATATRPTGGAGSYGDMLFTGSQTGGRFPPQKKRSERLATGRE